ncbi:uncharacterized protein LOC117231455 isoform X1 [Bombus vosnesenskii]|uniref:Uncharacterized protein LOC117231455 isoform X1 n=2 Tax=Pyrobombus TaxID=144703 RepID=A0A6J3JZR5_9HYME|nr:uncharacterized protein LOC117166647 isoform X1 [Bombus vancouverensis nearcticus]XP_033312092.1 uncharacterized protein LOC117211893 isoform X1 [Bombus bifarius]XP_033345796.1 uncharacterized protein LOC117231455 isoform X1 [Bombus vosnesenskii]XP_050470746.1 uncharacterized protein LOC126863975 isoform X2 [Bombus huntii]
MKVGLLKNFVHYFNLEEGTVLIAVFQLLISGFNMTFFVLALVHTMGIQEMVVRDTEDALEREALEDISSNHLNTKKMDMAHHNATETVYSIYCGLVITVIHFISTILLLYGVLANNRHFMAPWLVVMMTIISALTISVFVVEQGCPFIATLGGNADICERIIVLLVAISNSYVWLVVYSAYKSLETKKGLTHVLHGVKKKPAVPVVKKSKAVKAGANKPFEV